MRTIALAALALAFAPMLAPPADAHIPRHHKTTSVKATLKLQERSYAHAMYVCRRGSGEPKRWHCAAAEWLGRELRETRAKLRPAVDACLHELIERESHWNVHATNPTTGAYGLPQALPGSKMASAGPNWRHDPATQIRWMLGYVHKYGGSCGALAFQKTHGYY